MNSNYYNYNPYGFNNFSYQQPMVQQFVPLTFVNGEEEARRYIVEMNKTIYLRDNESNAMYIKYTDSLGKVNMKKYLLVEENSETNTQDNGILARLNALESTFNERLDKLSHEILASRKEI